MFPRHSSRQPLSKFIAKAMSHKRVPFSPICSNKNNFDMNKKAFVSAKQLIKGERQFMSFRHFFFEFEMEISTISSRNTSKCFRRWNFYYLFLQHKLLMPFFLFSGEKNCFRINHKGKREKKYFRLLFHRLGANFLFIV